MIHYEVYCDSPNQHYIRFKAVFPVTNSKTILKISAWRPGRYELGNFAKNIRNFKVSDVDAKSIEFRKTDKNSWLIQSGNNKDIVVEYEYFSTELNAGSTFLDDTQLYINPVNCFFYSDDLKNESYRISLSIPNHWKIACSLPSENKELSASNFDELADSPFICSPNLSYDFYEIQGIKFHLWFNNQKYIDWNRIKSDFIKFTTKQLEDFTHFPASEFHFLIHSLPYYAYHGVEHLKSTVITLGPSYEIFGALYSELLGVSSHELYHVWNVKSIRPVEMFPYDFEKENYSRLGYVYEGVTTYLGDLYLLKSGVFDLDSYLDELNKQLQKHFDNSGRFNYSVAQSSFDTWLDGYVAGAPGRKVSIYTEGCILAFIADIKIRKATKNKFGIEEVMKRLYFDFAKKGKGYTEADYRSLLESVSGVSFEDYFSNYINGTQLYDSLINESLEYLGLELIQKPSTSFAESKLGFKYLPKGKTVVIQSIFPGSPAEIGGLSISDEIITVNGNQLNSDLDKWLKYFENKDIKLSIYREAKLNEITLTTNNIPFYPKFEVKQKQTFLESQIVNLKSWGQDGIIMG
ncbi:MAG: M61 family metallopeptidase [Bacteroidetes bacterium]|nr:M61 family metallopeptidase [Bacteroidota bacterium]